MTESCSHGFCPWRVAAPRSSLLLPGRHSVTQGRGTGCGSRAHMGWLTNYQGSPACCQLCGWRVPHSTSVRLHVCSPPGLSEASRRTSVFGCVGRSTLVKDHSHLSWDPCPLCTPFWVPCTRALVANAESAPPKTQSQNQPFRQALQVVGCMSESQASFSG